MVAQVKWLEWDTGGGVGRCPTPAEVVRLSPTMARLEPMTPPELTAQAVLFRLPTQASVVLADFGQLELGVGRGEHDCLSRCSLVVLMCVRGVPGAARL